MNIQILLKEWTEKAGVAKLQSPAFDTESIFAEVLVVPRLELRLQSSNILSKEKISEISRLMGRRLAGEPLQYIVGKSHFRKLCLSVGPGVLIPRPETELIIDIAARYIKKGMRIADVGTGSGAIALAAASEFPDTHVTGIDISSAALERAESNRKDLDIKNVSFMKGDLLADFSENSFDMILSNPPYVSSSEYDELPSEVKDHEPENALHAGVDGLDIIRRLLNDAFRVLVSGGVLIVECGANQEKELLSIISGAQFSAVERFSDLTGHFRFIGTAKV